MIFGLRTIVTSFNMTEANLNVKPTGLAQDF